MSNILKGPPSKRRTFLLLLKQLVSFLWPITLERCATDPDLQLRLEFGRVVVNKGQANYSYGKLQDTFKQFFQNTSLPWERINRILILGYGAGSIAELVKTKYKRQAHITGIENNPCILHWHDAYFPQYADHMIQSDAADHMSKVTEAKYDLIIVDLFEELEVPQQFRSKSFLQSCKDRIADDSYMLFNFVVSETDQTQAYNELMLTLSQLFRSVEIKEHFESNRIFLAK